MKKRIILLLAWVLWGQYHIEKYGWGDWQVLDGYPTHEACKSVNEFLLAKAKKEGKKATYMCLPDTIDPRERKQ